MTHSVPDRLLPNRRLRRVLLAIQDNMGRNGLNAVLKLAGLQRYMNALPPDNDDAEIRASEYAALLQGIETQYGSGARGQLNRIGHATFRQIVAADPLAWRVLAFTNRLFPPKQRLRRALAKLAAHLAEPGGKVAVYTDDRRLLFADDTGDSTWGRQRNTEICWLTLGQLQECITWAAGVPYDVTEIACKAKGDPGCKFEVGEALN